MAGLGSVAAIVYYFKKKKAPPPNQRPAADHDANGNDPERVEGQAGVDNNDPRIRGENSPLLNSIPEISQDTKRLNIKKGERNNSQW